MPYTGRKYFIYLVKKQCKLETDNARQREIWWSSLHNVGCVPVKKWCKQRINNSLLNQNASWTADYLIICRKHHTCHETATQDVLQRSKVKSYAWIILDPIKIMNSSDSVLPNATKVISCLNIEGLSRWKWGVFLGSSLL